MNLNRKTKALLVATLASVSGLGLVMATATTAQASGLESLPRRLAARTVRDNAPPRRLAPADTPSPPRPEPAPPRPPRPTPAPPPR